MVTYQKHGSMLIVTVGHITEYNLQTFADFAKKVDCTEVIALPPGWRYNLVSDIVTKAVAEEREACANACRDEIEESDDAAEASGAAACLRRIEARGEKEAG